MIQDDAASVLEGTLIDGQFRICHRLGEGGMGTVWAAEELQLERMVAAKFLWQHMAADPRVRQRFQREARMTARVRSPHVVQVFAQGCTADDVPYMIMELLDGEDLSAYLQRCGRCGLRETADIVRQVCRGLGCAHAEGLVHRDIKPHNVFLTHDDARVHVKLLDFGIAKDLASLRDSLTACGEVVGSALYSSPEQLRDPQSVDRATDVWALGVVIYEMLTGVVPFAANSFADLIELHREGRFASPRDIASELPRELDGFFERALHGDPRERFASVEELAQAFTAVAHAAPDVALGGVRTMTTTASDTRGGSMKAGRARWVVAVLAMGALGFVLARAWILGPAAAKASRGFGAAAMQPSAAAEAAEGAVPGAAGSQGRSAGALEQTLRAGAARDVEAVSQGRSAGALEQTLRAGAARDVEPRRGSSARAPDPAPAADPEARRALSGKDRSARTPERAAMPERLEQPSESSEPRRTMSARSEGARGLSPLAAVAAESRDGLSRSEHRSPAEKREASAAADAESQSRRASTGSSDGADVMSRRERGSRGRGSVSEGLAVGAGPGAEPQRGSRATDPGASRERPVPPERPASDASPRPSSELPGRNHGF